MSEIGWPSFRLHRRPSVSVSMLALMARTLPSASAKWQSPPCQLPQLTRSFPVARGSLAIGTAGPPIRAKL